MRGSLIVGIAGAGLTAYFLFKNILARMLIVAIASALIMLVGFFVPI